MKYSKRIRSAVIQKCKLNLLWISFFVFLFALSGIYEICKAYKRSVSGDDDFFVPFEDKNVVSLGDVYYNDINID